MSVHGKVGSKKNESRTSNRDGNVIVMALLGLVVVVLIGFGLPRLLQRREPGLENDSPTASTSQEKKKRSSIFGSDEELESGASEKKLSAQGRESESGELSEEAEAALGTSQDHDAPLATANAAFGKDAEGYCTGVEEPGKRASDIKLTQKVWMPVVEDFRAAKRKVVDWMKKHPEQFPEERRVALTEKILDLQIQRPPSEEEPDLAWRGMVVLSRFPDGKPLLRVGGGFLALHQKAPQRARFELARAVALMLSPCELKKMEFAGVWDQAFSCTQGVGAETCDMGSISQQAWLVASAIAQETQAPGCTVRAVEKSGFLGCVAKNAVAGGAAPTRAIASNPAQGAEQSSKSESHGQTGAKAHGGHHE